MEKVGVFGVRVIKAVGSVLLAGLVCLGGAVVVLAAGDGPVMPEDDDVVAAPVVSEAKAETAAVAAPSSSRYTTDRVNFRTGPSTGYAVITVLPVGTEVKFVAFAAENLDKEAWCEVVYGDKKGFVKTEYLTNVKPAIPAVGAVELMSWEDVKGILKIGVVIPILDIKTGLTYNVKSFSNGLHADVEPVTREDTATLKRTFGGVWDWDGRPVVAYIAGRGIAAAINGMPHGGGVNFDNGMDGQVCLHFKDSHVHNGNKSYERELQGVVNYAYNLTR